jgi:hypothetical protein
MRIPKTSSSPVRSFVRTGFAFHAAMRSRRSPRRKCQRRARTDVQARSDISRDSKPAPDVTDSGWRSPFYRRARLARPCRSCMGQRFCGPRLPWRRVGTAIAPPPGMRASSTMTRDVIVVPPELTFGSVRYRLHVPAQMMVGEAMTPTQLDRPGAQRARHSFCGCSARSCENVRSAIALVHVVPCASVGLGVAAMGNGRRYALVDLHALY